MQAHSELKMSQHLYSGVQDVGNPSAVEEELLVGWLLFFFFDHLLSRQLIPM